MINILHKITKAQRTGNWLIYLKAVSECLPFFAATGHYSSAKFANLYLQSMNKLSSTNPDVYQIFMNGHHVVRWSNRFWAGTDLAIEQRLMSSVNKASGTTELQHAK